MEPARAGASVSDGWLTACVSLASAALFFVLAWPMLSGGIFGGDDLTAFHLPVRWFYWNALHNGDAFDWLPDAFCGFFLTGEGQGGTYHPAHLALYRWLPFPTAFNLEVWLSYPAMFAGMVFLLRRGAFGCSTGPTSSPSEPGGNGSPPGLPLHAALFGAMLFTFSSSCLLHFMHINAIAVVAHLPWLLLAIDVAVRTGRARVRTIAFAAIALLTASAILCGHPQYLWICFVGELLWLGLAFSIAHDADASRFRAREAWRVLLGLGFAKLLGSMIGAIQLLPTLDHLLGSQRHQAAVDVAHLGALHPLNVVQFVAPFLFSTRVAGSNTHEYGLYAGAVPIVLCAWLFSRREGRGRAGQSLQGVALFGIVAFVLSLGSYGGLHQLFALLPGVGEFRLPARYLVLVHFAIAVLASAALARIGEAHDPAGRRAWPGGWILVAVSVLFTSGFHVLLSAEQSGSLVGAAIGPLLFLVAVALFTLALQGSRIAVPLLIVLAAADSGYYGFSYVALPGATSLESILAGIPAPQANAARLATMQPYENGKFLGNQWTMRGWRLSDGYAGLLPASRLDEHTLAGLRMANVGLVLRRSGQPLLDGLTIVDETLAAVPDPLPRVRMATRALVSVSPAEDARSLSSALLEGSLSTDTFATTVLVDDPISIAGPTGQAKLLSDRPGDLQIEVHAPAGQLLVVADRFHSGWKASIDGEAADVLRVDGHFLGVPVQAGASTVRLVFEPVSLRYGKAVSLAGCAAWALLFAVGMLRSRDDASDAALLADTVGTRRA